jgi:hypothetical protein
VEAAGVEVAVGEVTGAAAGAAVIAASVAAASADAGEAAGEVGETAAAQSTGMQRSGSPAVGTRRLGM